MAQWKLSHSYYYFWLNKGEEEINLRLIDTGDYQRQEKQYLIDMYIYAADAIVIMHNSTSMSSPLCVKLLLDRVHKIRGMVLRVHKLMALYCYYYTNIHIIPILS